MKFAFIHKHLQQFPVNLLCRVLKVSTTPGSGELPSEITLRQESLAAEIQQAQR